MTQEVAKTILAQLGGNKFIAMTGSKNFLSGETYLLFSVGRGAAKKIKKVKITLEPSDLYTMEFFTWKQGGMIELELVETHEGVWCDKLQEIFTEVTGMRTHL